VIEIRDRCMLLVAQEWKTRIRAL